MEGLSDPFLAQKRVRNITGLAVRHLDVTELRIQCPFSMGFTLSSTGNSSHYVYFTSQLVENSANPRWEEISLPSETSTLNTFHCVLTLFAIKAKADVQCLLRWTVDLRALQFIGHDLDSVELDFRPNAVLFLLKSGVYTGAQDVPLGVVKFTPPPSRAVRKTCSSAALRQLLKLEKDLAQVQGRRRSLRDAVEDGTSAVAFRSDTERRIEILKMRTKNFGVTLDELRKSNLATTRSNSDLQHRNQAISSALDVSRMDLRGTDSESVNRRSDLTLSRKALKRQKEDMRRRQRELISNMRFVYPIHRSPSGRSFITGIWLPTVDQHVNCDDTTLSASLGYAVHLVVLLSKILDVPLRYPLKFYCSMSAISDPISPKLTDKEREYPVYVRSRDRARYHYGVFFLNLDIAQLRASFGLGTPDLKKTLENLQSFMEEKFSLAVPTALTSSHLAISEPVSGFSPMTGGVSNPTITTENGIPTIPTVQSTPDFRRTKTIRNTTSAVFVPNGNN